MATRTITHWSLGGGKPVAVDFSLIVRDASQFSAGNAGRALSRRPLLPAQRSDAATARAARALGPGSPDGLRVAGACAGACREHCAGFTVAAASSLVICRNTLYRKMRG
ncbi:MAG: hypothetical protein ABI845_01275 [Polaromonas sp.]